jgi:hypothetical protein
MYLTLIHFLVFSLAPSKFICFQFGRRQWLPFSIVHLYMLSDAQYQVLLMSKMLNVSIVFKKMVSMKSLSAVFYTFHKLFMDV